MKELELLKKIVGDGKTVETHASIAYITDEYVYKIKKPVYFGFLDYRQLKQRRSCCILEKELNSRYSDGVYLSVLKLAKRSEEYELLPVESSIPAVEYVLQMRRIPDEQFLSNIIDTDEFTSVEMDWIGAQIGEKLALAERSPEFVEDMPPYEIVAFNAKENFQQLKDVAPDKLDDRFHFVEKATMAFLTEEEELIKRRYAEGFVKDGHGDLRLEHIYIKDDKLGLIDCIEFNTRFRTNDVVSEAAFLSMELDYAGRLDLSDAFLKGFFKVFPDKDSHKMLNFYRCYRAMVRAKVAVFTMLGTEDNTLKEKKLAEYHKMIDMATVYAMSIFHVTPLVFCGMIATGKSGNAKRFAHRFPALVVNTDEVRKQMSGLKPTEKAILPVGQGIYSSEITSAVYSEMGRLAENAAKLGRMVISDGTFRKKENRDDFEKSLTAKPTYICFTASDEMIKTRLQAREQKTSVTDGRMIHFDELKNTSNFECTHSIDTTEEKHDVNKILDFLIK